MKKQLFIATIAASLLAVSCGDDESSSAVSVTTTFAIEAANRGATSARILAGDYGTVLAAGAESTAFDCNSESSYSEYFGQYGGSGAPESMTINIKSIKLSSSQESLTTTLFTSAETNGDAIELTNGEVDLSGLTLETSLTAGTYDRVTVVFNNAATIKGCITEQFKSNSGECDGTDTGYCEAFSSADAGEELTLCTRSAYNTFDIVKNNQTVARSAYTDSTTAEATTVPLDTRVSADEPLGEENSDVSFDFDLPVPVVIGTASSGFDTTNTEEPVTVETTLSVSMVIDLNLALAFDGNARSDANGGHPYASAYGDVKGAYFHTQYFPDIARVFVGEVGSVEGYHVDACYDNDSGDDWRHTKFWITTIFDSSDQLASGVIMPYDQAGMILLKGEINPETAENYTSTKTGTSYKLNLGRLYEGVEEVHYLDGFVRGASVGAEGTIDATASDQTLFNDNETSGTAEDNSQDPAYFNYVRKL